MIEASQHPVIVQKYGGSSVANVERLREVAMLVKKRRDQGYRLCIVVSAMGKTTDQLLSLARELSSNPSRRELDMLLSCGERASMALLAMALHELDVPSISFTGSQSGIITDDVHSGARIIEVRPHRVCRELELGNVVIVAGFQGVSYKREITTLGRGGSDTTAIALAAALDAQACEIYSDVAGVYSADPRVVADAQLLAAISFDEMEELASFGAKVLNSQAVALAKKRGVKIYARGTGVDQQETIIDNIEIHRQGKLLALAHQERVFCLRLSNLCDMSMLLERFVGAGIMPMHVAASVVEANSVQGFIVIGPENAHGLREVVEMTPGAQMDDDCGTVSLVGREIANTPAILTATLSFLKNENIAVNGFFTSSLRATLLINKDEVALAARFLHQHFFTKESV